MQGLFPALSSRRLRRHAIFWRNRRAGEAKLWQLSGGAPKQWRRENQNVKQCIKSLNTIFSSSVGEMDEECATELTVYRQTMKLLIIVNSVVFGKCRGGAALIRQVGGSTIMH
jgi:hypothetical protein